MENSKPSSIVTDKVKPAATEDQFSMSTVGLIIFLIIAMISLKSFIYIKDGKRSGK